MQKCNNTCYSSSLLDSPWSRGMIQWPPGLPSYARHPPGLRPLFRTQMLGSENPCPPRALVSRPVWVVFWMSRSRVKIREEIGQ